MRLWQQNLDRLDEKGLVRLGNRWLFAAIVMTFVGVGFCLGAFGWGSAYGFGSWFVGAEAIGVIGLTLMLVCFYMYNRVDDVLQSLRR